MKFDCSAEIQHTKESVRTLFQVRAHTYEKRKILTRLVIGAAFVIVGLLLPSSFAVQAIFLMIGAWLLVSKDFASTQKAEDTMQIRGNTFPKLCYQFWETGFEVRDGKRVRIKYSSLDRLVEDTAYFYLFESSSSVCMVDKKSVQGMSAEALMQHIEEKSGKRFETNKSFLSMNLKDVLRLRRKK